MKTKRETEGRGYREMLEIDCSTGPRHRDFIYRIRNPLQHSPGIFRMLDMMANEQNMLTISPLNFEVFVCIHQNTLHYSLLRVCMVKTNGVRFMGDAVSHSSNSLRQNGFGQAGKTTDVVLECDTPGCQIFPVAAYVLGADLAQVLANGEQQGRWDFQAKTTCLRSDGTLQIQVP